MIVALIPAPVIAGVGLPDESGLANVATHPSEGSPWRIGASYALLLGLKTQFSGLGQFNSPFAPQPLGGGVNYDYDNGFVHVDALGNPGGDTSNWGYQNSSQFQSSGTGSIDFSITQSNSNGSVDENGGAHPGVDLFAYYEVGELGISPLKEHKATWGFRGGFLYSHVSIDNQDSIATDLTTTNDSFNLGGTIPPPAPFAGSIGGFGPLLGDSPTRNIGGGSGVVSGSREIDVDLSIVSFGTFFEVPVAKKFDIMAEAGFSLAIASGSYDYNSNTSISGLGTGQSSGSGSSTDFLPGVYFGLSGSYEITRHWSVQCAGRYQYMDGYDLDANGSSATLSFDSAFIVSLGTVYSF